MADLNSSNKKWASMSDSQKKDIQDALSRVRGGSSNETPQQALQRINSQGYYTPKSAFEMSTNPYTGETYDRSETLRNYLTSAAQAQRDYETSARQLAMNNYVRNLNQGRNAYNAVQNILQQNEERKNREAALQRLLSTLPQSEISSGNRANAVTEVLAKADNARNGLSYGLTKGLGYNSLVNAIGSAYENATGEVQPSLRAFNEETERAQRNAPNAFSAGNIAGNIALMGGVGSAAGAGLNALGATGRAARLAANALTFGGTEAIHGLGDVAQGNISPGRYAKNIGTSALGGVVGGEASNLVGTRMADLLLKKGMMTPFMEFVRQTASGTAFGAGNLAATQAVAYGTNDDEMKLNRRQAAEQLATTFGFSMINGAIRTLNATAAAKSALQSQVDQATAVYEQLTNGTFSEEEYIQRINTLMEFTDDLRKSINSQYLAGNQVAVNNMNDALDVIQESLRGKLSGIDAARAAGNVGNNILVDNIDPGVDATGNATPPVNGPESPTDNQLRALAEQTVDIKEAQRQALYEAGKNQEQNIQPLMDSATMLTEEEKIAAVRQGNQDAANAQIEAVKAEIPIKKATSEEVDVTSPGPTPDNELQQFGRLDGQTLHPSEAALPEAQTIGSVVEESVSTDSGSNVPSTATNSSINNLPSEAQSVKENLNVRAEQTGADSLRGRSIRVLSQRTGEPAGGVQPAAGGAGEAGNARTYADPEAEVLRIGEEIKGEEVVRTAVPGQTVYAVEGDTQATKEAKAVASAVGAKKTTLYASESGGLKVKSGKSVVIGRGSCDPASESISACVNDSRATAVQIVRHEAVELGVARGTVEPQAIYDTIKADDEFISSAIDSLVEMYAQYASEPLDAAHALKELLCDAGGGINQFSGIEGWEDVAETMDGVSSILRPILNDALGGALDANLESETVAETPNPIAAFSEQNNSKAVQYSIDQFSQSNGFKLVLNSEGMPYSIVDPATGKEVRPKDITPERVKNTPQGRMIAAAEKTGVIDAKTADAQRRFTADVMRLCVQYKDQATVWEITGASAFSSFKSNSDSQYGSTVDFGTICSKTQPIVDVMSNTMVEKGRGLKRDEVLKVYDAVAKTGLSVPCPVCYVFSRWVGVPSLLETMRRGQERFGENTTAEAVNAYISTMESKYNGKDGINNAKVKVQNKVQKLQQDLLKARGNDAEIGRIAKETKAVEKELADLEIYNWVTQVRCKTDRKRNPIRDSSGKVALDPNYRSVPNEVLLNLNRTGEFARDFPKQWLFRTTRGAGMGKAILPYSGAGLGDAVKGAGIAKPTLYAKDKNPFFTGDDKKAVRDLVNAQKRMKAQNLIGGQRLQSTSDFRAEWGLDYIADLMEMQNVGAKGQLYTKVIEAVDLLATAGNEVNLSIMGKGNGYHIDSNGKPVLGVEDFSSVTGIDFRAAYEKVKKYDNVQMILVGINDTHVRLALADKRIGFVIPWHASGSSEDVLRTLMDSNNEKLVKGTDYTPVQDDKVIDYGDKKLNAEMKSMRDLRKAIVMGKLKKGVTSEQQALLDKNEWLQDLYNRYYVDQSAEEYGVKLSGKQAEKIFPYEYWDKSLTLKDADQNGYRFQEYCASLGLKPRFSGAVVNGETIGDFSNDPGYWKLLIDRSMYNNDGTYHETQVIDVTKIKISQVPMTVNSNLYRDDSKLKQATMDSLKALDQQPNDVSMTMDVGDSEISEDVVMAEEAVQNSTSLNLKDLTPEEKERFAQYRKQYQDRLRARREARKARQELLKKANRAVKLAKNRPGYAAEAIKDLVNDLDLVAVGMRKATKDKLREKYFEILKMRQEDPNYAALHSEKDMRKVERLFKKQIKDMDIDDVRDLITELSALIHYQETQNKLFKDSKNRTVAEAGRQWVKDLQELKPLNITSGVKQLGAKYLRNNLSPERAVRMISGYKRGSVASELVRNIEDGLTKQKEFEQKADQLFRPFLEDKANADFVKNASKQTIRIEDADGNSAMISPAMRVALYMHSKNTDNLKHIASGGVTIPDPRLYEQGKYYDAYDRGVTLKLDPTEIENIIADMTPSETDYAGLLGTFFDTYSKDAINEASMTLDGIFKAVVDNYFPITSDKNFLAKAMDLTNDPTLEGWNNLKARQEGSSNPIMLEDVTKVLQRHITKTGQYYGLAVPLRDFQKVYGYTSSGYETSVQKAIGKTWDADTKKYLEQWITDLNTGGRQAEKGILDTMRGVYAGSVLTLNPSVALKQTTSYSMAGSILDFGSLMYGLGHRFTKADQAYMDSITPWGWARRQGQSTIELGDLAKQKQSLANKIPNWNQAMDVWTTNRLFLATEKSIQNEYPNLQRGDKEYDEALAERYNQVLWRTQPQYEAMFRPEYLRKTDIGSRTFGMFKTESMQMSGELIDALGQWRADSERAKDGTDENKRAKSESARHFYKTMASWLASNMMFAIFGSTISIALMHKGKQYRDEKGEITLDSIAKQTAKQFGSSVFGGMFALGNVYDVGQYLYDVIHKGNGNWYDIEAPGFSLINDAINNAGTMIGTLMNEEANAEARRKSIAKFAMSISKFTPIGFSENLYNMLNSVNLYIQDAYQGSLGRYEAGKGLLADTSPDKAQYANMAVSAATKGDARTLDRALENTNKAALEKAIGAEDKYDDAGEKIDGSKKQDGIEKVMALKTSDANKAKILDILYPTKGLDAWKGLGGDAYTYYKYGVDKISEDRIGVLESEGLDVRKFTEYVSGKKTPALNDAPNQGFDSYDKLRTAYGPGARNENLHHIVEQEQSETEGLAGFASSKVQNFNNIVSIPSGTNSVHTDISRYYTSKQDFTNGKTVREWLAGKSFEEQWEFGIKKLEEYGKVVPTEKGWAFIPDADKIEDKIPTKPETIANKYDIDLDTVKEFDSKISDAKADGTLSDNEIRGVALEMMMQGVNAEDAYDLYMSKNRNDTAAVTWVESGNSFKDYLSGATAMSEAKEIKDADAKRQKVVEYLDGFDGSDAEKQALWKIAGYGESTYNQYNVPDSEEYKKAEESAKKKAEKEADEKARGITEETKAIAKEIDAKIPEDTDKYLFVSQSKEWTPEQKVEWFKSDSSRTDGKKYKAWKNAGGVDYDYIKYRGDISRYDGLPKKEKKSKVTEYINSTGLNAEKKRVLWTFAGYKESTCPW